MNIRDIQLGPNRPDPPRSEALGQSGKVAADDAAEQQANQAAAAPARDRVEISDAARAAAADGSHTQEINFARKALLGIPPLSMDRVADILKRIQEGYYSQPEVIKQTAAGVTNDLVGGENVQDA